MVGKPGRSGRTAGATRKIAYQVRLELKEAEAFDELVRRREVEVSESGATANASSVLRAIVRKTLLDEGLLPEATATPSKPAPVSKPAPSSKPKAKSVGR